MLARKSPSTHRPERYRAPLPRATALSTLNDSDLGGKCKQLFLSHYGLKGLGAVPEALLQLDQESKPRPVWPSGGLWARRVSSGQAWMRLL